MKTCEKVFYSLFLFFCHCSTPSIKHSSKEGTQNNEKKNASTNETYEKEQKMRKNRCRYKAHSIKVTEQEKILFEKICYSVDYVAEVDWVSDERILAYLTTIHQTRLIFLKRSMYPEFSTFLLRSLASENGTERLFSCMLLDRLLFVLSKDEYQRYVSNYIKASKRPGESVNMFFKGKISKMYEVMYVLSLLSHAITEKRIPLEWKYHIKEKVYLEHRLDNVSVFNVYEFFKKNE